MSRTFRRKGYEKTQGTTWDRKGDKVAGYYTERDYDRVTFRYGMCTYRAPTKQEYYKEYWRIHGDNTRNRWSPGYVYRERRQRENRSINKSEILKWINDGDYEPLTEANPRSCLWDWS